MPRDFIPRRPPYRLEAEPLGYGGCARVTLGTHRDDGHVAAVKQAYDAPIFVARLQREIEVQQKIDHPNVMPILDASPGFYWYAMPVADTDLTAFRAADVWSERALTKILTDVWKGLGAAHHLGHVHRDLTPGNVLRLAGKWVVSDFGLVTKGERESLLTLTRTGAQLGTAGFIAPEVIEDPHSAIPESDIYSLGVLASWAVSGQWPMQGMMLPVPLDSEWAQFVNLATARQPSQRRDAISWLRRRELDESWHERTSCMFCGEQQGFTGASQQCVVCKGPNVWGY
jgi:serine/threonine protein kinase